MTPYYQDDWLTVMLGDCRQVMAEMEPESVHCVVTSPPYWGLRDYGQDGQLGLEPTPEAYVESMVAVFREVKRVLRSDGTVWLNLGDSYAGGTQTGRNDGGRPEKGKGWAEYDIQRTKVERRDGLKPKDLVGIPWRVAFALQADGWYLRSDIIWSKPNPMPESVTDRPTKAHEYLFLLSKSPRYYYDADAVREAASQPFGTPEWTGDQVKNRAVRGDRGYLGSNQGLPYRNLRSVWTIATQPYPGAHFATFPRALVEPCIKAGSPEGGVVLDPFAGSGTTGLVAQRLSRRAVLIDLNGEYLEQVMDRNRDIPLGLGA
jgi:DNA modification methylase